jgi:glutamine---fructose-6-phosphate transaminase (isomerizing)
VVIGDEANARVSDLRIESVPEWLSPLVAVIPAQQLAAELASLHGADVDQPYGLTKVTRTR